MYRLSRSATADPGLSSPIIASKPRPPRHWSHLRRQPSTPHTPDFLQPARSPQAPAQPSNQLFQTPYTTAKLSLLTSPAASVHLTALSPPTKVLKVLPYMSWFPYDSMRNVLSTIHRTFITFLRLSVMISRFNLVYSTGYGRDFERHIIQGLGIGYRRTYNISYDMRQSRTTVFFRSLH
jgi:hypothetical protein